MQPTAPGARRPGPAGFTLLELIVVICLIAVFASFALERLLRYQEIAEKTAMEANLGAMRSGQGMKAAATLVTGGLQALPKLADENPIDWLADPPAGYLGALSNPPLSAVPKGSWYFDMKNKELVYRPQRTRFLISGADGDDRIRFKVIVKLTFDAADKGLVRELSELAIRPVVPVRWFPEF
jgi:general secretion pathway protein G